MYAGRSPYEYVFSNPVNLVDPTGMAAFPPPDSNSEDNGTIWSDKDGTWVYNDGIWEGQNGAPNIDAAVQIEEVTVVGKLYGPSERLSRAIKANSATNSIDRLLNSVISFIPGAEGAELGNAIDSYNEGDYLEAGFSGFSSIPFIGKFGKLFKFGKSLKRGSKITGAAKGGIKSVDDLIAAGTKMPKVKAGQQLSIKGNIDDIFNSLAKQGEKINPNQIKFSDGTLITKYSAKSGSQTLQINQGGKITKIRIE